MDTNALNERKVQALEQIADRLDAIRNLLSHISDKMSEPRPSDQIAQAQRRRPLPGVTT